MLPTSVREIPSHLYPSGRIGTAIESFGGRSDGYLMSGADTVCVQERLHIFHPEVQRRQLRHSYPSSAYVLHSSHALARGCLVLEFPSPLRLLLPLYLLKKFI